MKIKSNDRNPDHLSIKSHTIVKIILFLGDNFRLFDPYPIPGFSPDRRVERVGFSKTGAGRKIRNKIVWRAENNLEGFENSKIYFPRSGLLPGQNNDMIAEERRDTRAVVGNGQTS